MPLSLRPHRVKPVRVRAVRRSAGSAIAWLVSGACACMAALPASAQDADASAAVPAASPALSSSTAARAVQLAPTLSIGQTVTDRRKSIVSGDTASESITTLSAGLRMSTRSARLQGQLDYALTGVMYDQDSRLNDLQNRLAAQLRAELIDKRLFVDVQGSITQQPISALGEQSADGVVTSPNRTEVSSLYVRPVLQGTVGGLVDVQVEGSLGATDTGGAAGTSDSVRGSALVSLSSASGGRLGWNLNASKQITDFKAGRTTGEDRVVLGLSLRPDVDWQFRLRGGIEANNFRRDEGKDRYETFGAGLAWTPSPRTRVSLDGDKRSFGHSHAIALEHRSRRTLVRYSDGQDVSRGATETAQALVGAYDLFFQLYASQEPDPAKRQQLVESLLARNNLQRDSQVAVGFLTSAVTVQRRQELSLMVEGLRTSVIVSGFATHIRRADTLSPGLDDTAGDNTVRQRGLSVVVSHRLTNTSSLNLLASTVRGSESQARGRTDLRSATATWSERLGTRTNFSLGLRHTEFEADLDPYVENAVIANLSMRF